MARSLVFLIKALSPEAARVASPRFHHHLDASLRDLSIRRFNVVAPRGHAKSTLGAVALVLWHIFFQELGHWLDTDPARRSRTPPNRRRKYVVIIGASQREAAERLDSIKHVLDTSPLFRALFGDWGPDTAPQWTGNSVVLKDGTILKAVGMGQPIRGLNRRNLRPTLIVFDDPENEENTKTSERMQDNIRRVFQALLPSLDPEVGRMVVIGTPQNTRSMVVTLHNSFQGGRARGEASVWFENDEDSDTSRWSVDPDGEVVLSEGDVVEEDDKGKWVRREGVLWPEWMGIKRLREEKLRCERTEGVGVGVYYREYECKVVGNEEQIFKPGFFSSTWRGHLDRDLVGQRYLVVTHLEGTEFEEPLRLPCYVSTGVDPAFSTARTSDRTAISNLATTYSEERGEEVWELKGVYERLDPYDLTDRIASNHREVRPDRGIIEANQAQVMIEVDLRRHHNIRYLPIKVDQAKKGEGSRIASLEPAMNPKRRNLRWHHWPGSPLKAELLSYPRGHDDFADATEKAFRARRRPFRQSEADLVLDKEAQREHQKTRQRIIDPMTV